MVIFTSCTAKSGTYYLWYILSRSKECLCIIEPRKREGNIIAAYLGADEVKNAEEYWEQRLKGIKDNESKSGLYIESDFRFIGYSDLAVRDIKDVKVIELEREKAKIVRQITRNHYYSGYYFGWLLDPTWKSNITLINYKESSEVDRGIWYVFEIEERKRRFRERYPRIPVFKFDLEKKNLKMWKDLTNFIGIELTQEMITLIKEDKIVNSWEKRTDVLVGDQYLLENVRKKVEEYKPIYRSRK